MATRQAVRKIEAANAIWFGAALSIVIAAERRVPLVARPPCPTFSYKVSGTGCSA